MPITRKIQSLRLKFGASKLRALKKLRERQEALAFQRGLQAKEQKRIMKAKGTAKRSPSKALKFIKKHGKKVTKMKVNPKAFDEIYGFGSPKKRKRKDNYDDFF